MSSDQPPQRRNGKLRIPLPFEDALRAGLETPPADETKRTGNGRKPRKRPAKK